MLGLLLAGGRGSRMGGADKGLLPWQGQSLAAQVLARMRPQVQALAISANRNADRYAALGAPVLADAEPEAFAGPLAGLRAALDWHERRHDWVWLCACDTPRWPHDLLAQLWAARGDAPAVLPRDPHGHWQPTHALVHARLQGAARAAPAGSALGDWLRQQGATTLDVAGDWLGFNRPEDFEA